MNGYGGRTQKVGVFREPGRTHHQMRNADEGYGDGLRFLVFGLTAADINDSHAVTFSLLKPQTLAQSNDATSGVASSDDAGRAFA